ncbi:MAG: hypothetical protein ACK50D_07635 [Burkholderiales bacterium]
MFVIPNKAQPLLRGVEESAVVATEADPSTLLGMTKFGRWTAP